MSITAVVALVAAGLIGWGIYESQRPDTYTAPTTAGTTDDGLVLGEGPVTVDVYLDMLCPACKQFEGSSGATLDQLIADKKIKLVYHPIAILDSASTTKYSTRAGGAVAAAAGSGKLGAYIRALYEAQPPEGGAGLSDDELIRIAGTVGITDPSFAEAVKSGKYHSWVTHVTEVADSEGVRSTPTVIVAGKQVQATAAAVTTAVNAAS